MYPIKFENLYYDKVWGGRDLKEFRRNLPEGKIGESWDIACHENGTGIVENGKFKGMTFKELIENYKEEIFGKAIKNNEFVNNALKFALYDSTNRKLATGSIPSKAGSRVLMTSGKYLKSNYTENFTVLIWLQENNKNQDYEKGKTFTGGFEITATQIKYK